MYTATPLSKHRQYTSHICDRRWPPVHTQHTTTHNDNNNEFDDHDNEEQQEQYHNHHNHHQQPRYHHQQLDNGPNDATRVVWAIRWVFLFFVFFLYTKHYIQQLWIY